MMLGGWRNTRRYKGSTLGVRMGRLILPLCTEGCKGSKILKQRTIAEDNGFSRVGESLPTYVYRINLGIYINLAMNLTKYSLI